MSLNRSSYPNCIYQSWGSDELISSLAYVGDTIRSSERPHRVIMSRKPAHSLVPLGLGLSFYSEVVGPTRRAEVTLNGRRCFSFILSVSQFKLTFENWGQDFQDDVIYYCYYYFVLLQRDRRSVDNTRSLCLGWPIT